jgi:small multidrug resistance family-3 protein
LRLAFAGPHAEKGLVVAARPFFMTYLIYIVAALAEIAGCFSIWAWWRLEKSPLWLAPGLVSLALFGFLLALVDISAAGRAYAAYGGIYIAASLGWLWLVEGVRPDRWDLAGSALCIVGTSVILLAPRGA